MKLANIIATCENLDQLAKPVDDVAHAEATTELVDTESAMATNYKQIDDIDTGIGDALTSMDRLDEATDTVAANPDETVSETEVTTVESLMSNIHYTLGLPHERVTMESLSSSSRSDLVATMESKLEAIGQAIVKGLQTAWEMVKRFFNQLFQNKAALKKYLEGVQSKVAQFSGDGAPANIAGFNSYERSIEGLKTADVMMDMVNASAEALNETIGQHHSETPAVSSANIAKIIGNKTNDILTRGTTMRGKGGEGEEIHGLCSGNKGITAMAEKTDNPLAKIKPYAAATGDNQGLNQGQMRDLLNKALATLERFSKLKRFENIFATAFKSVRDLVMAGYNKIRAIPSKDKPRTDAQNDHAKQGNKRLLVTIFRGVAHIYGTTLPREVFMNISNIGKYVEASLRGKAAPAKSPVAAATGDAQTA